MNSPIRILYIIGQLGMGGSERQLYLLLKYMDKTRFNPHVLVFNPSPNYTMDDDLCRLGVPVYKMPASNQTVPTRLAWLIGLARRLRPHIIHSWTLHDNAYAALAGFFSGIPVRLGSVRGTLVSPGFTGASSWERWLILHGVQGHLVNSARAMEELRSAGVASQRIQFIPNCVELSSLTVKSNPSNARRIGMVANLRRVKNYPLFLQGLARILPEFPFVIGVVVGQPILPIDADVPGQIEEEIRRLGLVDHICQQGFQVDVSTILADLEIFCLTSDSEGMPNALLEAMSAGLPVVATKVGGIPQIVEHGVTGFLIPPGDVDAFASALRELLENPSRARLMGNAGRQRVERDHSPQVVLPALESYYLSQI